LMRSPEMLTSEQSWYTALLPLSGLEPNQNYEYRLLLDGVPIKKDYSLRFHTPIEWAPGQTAPDFEVITGSCYYVNDEWMKMLGIEYGGPLQIFTTMEKHPADFMLWLGDNIYLAPLDVSNRWRMNSRYRKQRSQTLIQPLLGRMPQYAIWDDHDFGPNNSTKNFPLKDVSLELFKAYWANPRYGLLTENGTWSRFRWNDIDFFLTDGRYYRDALKVPEDQRRMLGSVQMAWLKNELKASRSPFKMVVVGSPVFNPYYDESFAMYPLEYQELLEFIRQEKIEGVVFLSGDRHHSDLHVLKLPGVYTLYNYTNSPLTSSPTKIMNSQELNDPERVPGTLVKERNYGVLKFSGPAGQRVLTLETRDGSGKLFWAHEIKEEDLRFQPTP